MNRSLKKIGNSVIAEIVDENNDKVTFSIDFNVTASMYPIEIRIDPSPEQIGCLSMGQAVLLRDALNMVLDPPSSKSEDTGPE